MFLYEPLAFVLVFVYSVNCYDGQSDSDDDDKLKQALVLVDILKKEYLKLLQSHYVLQQQQQALQEQGISIPTLMPTEAQNPLYEVIKKTKENPSETQNLKAMDSGNELSGLLSGRRAEKVPIDQVWNKKLLANYRRALSEPENGTIPNASNDTANENKTENVTTDEGKESVNNVNKTEDLRIGEAPAKDDKQVKEDKKDNKAAKNNNQQNTKKKKKQNKTTKFAKNTKPPNKIKNTKIKTPEKISTKDPVVDQIASVLKNELKEDVKEEKKVNSIPQYKPLEFKPTLRIHNAKSTRLPIPFSENNAFCYYVPHSSLCVNGT